MSDNIRDILAHSRGLSGLPTRDKEELVDKVMDELKSRYAHYPAEQQISIARRKLQSRVVDLIRRKQAEQKALDHIADYLRASDDTNDPAVLVAKAEFRYLLARTVVYSLSQDERTAIKLRFYDSKNLNDVASALNTSASGACNVIARALDKLQFCLERYADLAPTVFERVSVSQPPDLHVGSRPHGCARDRSNG